MAPSVLQLSTEPIHETRAGILPCKKRKSHHIDVDADDEANIRRKIGKSHDDPTSKLDSSIPPHDLGIKPLGNIYDASGPNAKTFCGRLSRLPDELLVQVLENLEASELVRLGSTCKALYAFTRSDELWRTLFVSSSPSNFRWLGTWRSTCLSLPPDRVSKISCSNLYSDALHRPFFCAHVSLLPFTLDIPARNQISRLSNLSSDEFSDHWADRPFILTSPVKTWPVYRDWNVEHLLSRFSNTAFRAEAVDWPLHTYVDYMRLNADESPLYLFDRAFASKMSVQPSDYAPPTCFGADLFDVLGSDRPDHAWLIIGPARSGSTFHKDPNGTSAWNAVLRGAKYWIMFPSASGIPPPPGVYVSDDQSEVTSPLSIAEWLLGFHAEARRTPRCVEGICGEGEVLHVPSGWYHLVLNMEESVAITQNFVPKAHLPNVLEFLRDRPDQVSGFADEVKDPHALFVQRLRAQYPELLDDALIKLEAKAKPKKSTWEQLSRPDTQVTGFGFGGGGEDDDIP